MVKSRKKKRKRNYVLLVVSDAPTDKIKQYRFTKTRINFIKTIAVILMMILIGYISFSAFCNSISLSREENLRDKITELEEKEKSLENENLQLQDKVNILSETVNQKVDAEKVQQEKNMPTGFPLSGTADMLETTESVMDGENEVIRPIVLFKTGDGVTCVASGGGTVILVEEDSEYGYQVQVDHENGYVSIYRSGTQPKVKVGDEVTRGTHLYEMEINQNLENSDQMGYQITKDGEYIEPTEVLEING